MDRDLAREDLVLHALVSRSDAALIRSRLDHSEFGSHAPLVMLIADHDIHHPDASPQGLERWDSLAGHISARMSAQDRSANPGRLPRATDPRWALAAAAQVDMMLLAGLSPTEPDLGALLAAFDERRGAGTPPAVPGQSRLRRWRRRSTDRRP